MMKSCFFRIIFLFILVLTSVILAQSSEFPDHPRGLHIPEEVREYWQNRHLVQKSIDVTYASSKDWSHQDSDVKNQHWCGSCWAFAAVALVENIGDQGDLSEQVLISCSAAGDCGGGWYGEALYYIKLNGIPDESCYPYQIDNGNCGDKCDNPDFLEKINSCDRWGQWGDPDENTVQNLKGLLQSGPAVVAMEVPTDGSFDFYSGGVYDYSGNAFSGNTSHAVLLVGYDDSEGCFKVKNSWGSSWGEDGYFRIAYDDVTDHVQFGGFPCTASGAYTVETDTETISTPGTPNGETSPLPNVQYSYSTSGATSNLGHTIEYRFDWGDGSTSDWSISKSASYTWTTEGERTITVTARCQDHTEIQSESAGLDINVNIPEEIVSKPGTPNGNSTVTKHIVYTYSTSGASSNLGHILEYQFEWGDGSQSGWSSSKTGSHSWATTGNKTILVRARCVAHPEKNNISDELIITVEEPETISKPGIPEGETSPTRDETYSFTTTGAASNLGHTLEYQFYWGDGTNSGWIISTSASHSWSTNGSKIVFVSARCKQHPDKMNVSTALEIQVHDPETISIPGTPIGKRKPSLGFESVYSTEGAFSSLGHDLEYSFDWGDSTYSEWTDSKSAAHVWHSLGEKAVSVMTRCKEHTTILNASDTLRVTVMQPPVTVSFLTVPPELYLEIEDTLVATPCSLPFIPGDTISVNAPSPQGFCYFASWSHHENASRQIIIPEKDTLFTAHFQLEQFSLTTSVNDTNMGSITLNPDDNLYDAEMEVILQAIPKPGFQFSHWSDSLSSTSNPDTLVMNSPKSIQANFVQMDQTSPLLTMFYPEPGTVSVPRNDLIQWKIEDDTSGIHLDSVMISINGTLIYHTAMDPKPERGLISVHPVNKGYWMIYQPEALLPANSQINVHIHCGDGAYHTNVMDTTLSFFTGSAELSIVAQDTFQPENGFEKDLIPFEFEVPVGSIDDKLLIRISTASNIQPLPDTLIAESDIWHIGPHGILLGESNALQVKLQSSIVEDTLVDPGNNISIYTLLSDTAGWLPLQDEEHMIQLSCLHTGFFILASEVKEMLTYPGTPVGDTLIFTDSSYVYATYPSTSNLGNEVEYNFHWGNGTQSGWSADTSVVNMWTEPGNYDIVVLARSIEDTTLLVGSDTLEVHVESRHTGISELTEIPINFELYQNYPNPFNPQTSIRFGIPREGHITLKVYNMMGQHVCTLIDDSKPAGYHEIIWHARDDYGQNVGSGIYFYVLQGEGYIRRMKAILLK